MNICFVYQSNYPWDIRVSKILNTLTEEGHKLFLVCANELDYSRQEILDGVTINRLPHTINNILKSTSIINFPAFFNPYWKREILHSVAKNEIDLIIVRDLPLAITAIKIGKKFNIPVFLDMAESYPELLRSMWEFGAVSPIKRFTHNPILGDMVERKVIKHIDHIFAMVQESKDRLIKLGADENIVSIVSNTPPLDKFNSENMVAKQSDDAIIKILYAGWVTKGRGVDIFIDNLSEISLVRENKFQLDIYGDGDALENCKKIAKDKNIDKYINFHGWCSNNEIVEATKACHVGLVSHRVCGHWNNTIPNKLFDYMASGIPVLSSNTLPVKRIVEETNSGLIYEENNVKSVEGALISLLSSKTRIELAKNGINSVKKKYHWEADAEIIINAIENLEKYNENR